MSALPSHETLMGVFDNHWSEKLWTKIEKERDANGFNLNESIWKIANNAQNKAFAIIKDAEQNGTTFGKVKDDLAALLTEKGKSNMGYNVRRLWVNQLKADRIIAQRQVWNDMGYIQNVILSRSDHAMPCEICDEEVGEGPDAERVVPLDYGNWPPYHPWCECDAQPEKPSAKSIADFLKGNLGSPDMQEVVKTIAYPVTQTTERQSTEGFVGSDQAYSETRQKEEAMTWEKIIHRASDELKYFDSPDSTGALWSSDDKKDFFNSMDNRMGNIEGMIPPPSIEPLKMGMWNEAEYTEGTASININIDKSWSPISASDTILHEYGHHLQDALSNPDLLPYIQPDELSSLTNPVQGLLDAIQEYTVEIPDLNSDTLIENVGADKIALTTAINELNHFEGTGHMLAALSDMGMGALGGGIAHDNSYLMDSFLAIHINGRIYGIAEQEAFNELWVSYQKTRESPDVVAIDATMNKYFPSLLQVLEVFAKMAGRNP